MVKNLEHIEITRFFCYVIDYIKEMSDILIAILLNVLLMYKMQCKQDDIFGLEKV